MKTNTRFWISLSAALGMLLLILDSKTALQGAAQGIEICIQTAIPSLFPFFLFSVLLTSGLFGVSYRLLRPFTRLLGIPKGSESLFLIGLVGGYPTGAQCIAQSCRSGALSKQDGLRMMGFCCNAGPAFIFGMVAHLFASPVTPWYLWAIQILSAFAVGLCLPKNNTSHASPVAKNSDFGQAMNVAVKAMASVCGWIILFRILIVFLDRWFLWLLPSIAKIALIGSLEISNGCIALEELPSEGLRFLLCGCMLSFGGLCVGMQTVSVTYPIGTGLYFPGKLLQLLFTFFGCGITQAVLFPTSEKTNIPAGIWSLAAAILGITLFLIGKSKNKGRNFVSLPV